MTSGALPPASVASNFAEVGPHCLVLDIHVPRREFWALNCALAAATTSGQPDCASVCSQTVSVFAAAATGRSGSTYSHDRQAPRRARPWRKLVRSFASPAASGHSHQTGAELWQCAARSTQVVCTNLPRAGGFHIRRPAVKPAIDRSLRPKGLLSAVSAFQRWRDAVGTNHASDEPTTADRRDRRHVLADGPAGSKAS